MEECSTAVKTILIPNVDLCLHKLAEQNSQIKYTTDNTAGQHVNVGQSFFEADSPDH
jgi:hypothetical protein